ncbi:hypothetical protein GCM10027447_16970 [Glycomyces halotolerans]
MQGLKGKFVKGSEPASVYWRRRAIVAAAAVVLTLVIVLVVKALGSGGGASAEGGADRSASAWAEPSSSSTLKRPYISAPPEGEPSPEPTTPAVPACPEADLMLQVVAAFEEARAGSEVPVSVLVASGADRTCTVELSRVEVELAAGTDLVSSTAHCESLEEREVELEAGAGETVELRVDGLASEPGCEGERRRLPAGDYELRARLGEAVSQPTSLRFT